ncbi:MAG: prolyl-tRNA synthetase, partial [Patescibacteria group bacterium]|nr:prolyl-tRNA synthetase [Patescibacteria group bacterium]
RAKSGLMRTREFIMKDLYSFSKDAAQHDLFYEQAQKAYKNIFNRVGIGDKTYLTRASGGSFSKFSHEFQTVCSAGEDNIHVAANFDIAVNEEIINEKEAFEGISIPKSDFKPVKAIEVGNIFTLGTRFSEVLGLTYKDAEGKDIPVFMGSYGIGPARLMATVVELMSDDKGIVWPAAVAPFRVHLVELSGGDAAVKDEAEEVYKALVDAGIEVFFDDRDARAGEKFADADLIGIPLRVVVSAKTLAEGKFECTQRAGATTHLSLTELITQLSHA